MPFQTTPYLPALAASALLSLVVAALAWRHRERPGAGTLAVLMAAAAWWTAGSAVGVSATDLPTKLFVYKLTYLGIAVVPVAWLAFAAEYTGREIGRRALLLACTVPVATVTLVLTNHAHGLIWREVGLGRVGDLVVMTSVHGAGFWAFTAFAYLLLAAGTLLVARTAVLADWIYRDQSLMLLGAVVVPWAANALFLADLTPAVDPTPLGFAMSGALLMAAMYRRRLLDLLPVASEMARNELIEQLGDAVFVLDDRGQVVDRNPAARRLAAVDDPIGTPVEAALPALASFLERADGGESLEIERAGERRYYDVRTSALERAGGVLTGRLVSLRDVTERRRREQRLDVLNRLLTHNVRNEMTAIRGQADLVQSRLDDEDLRERLATVKRTVDTVTDWSEKARHVAGERPFDGRDPVAVTGIVEDVVGATRDRHPRADVSVDMPPAARAVATPALDLVLDELLANAIEHADGTPTVAVTVERGDERVRVRVEDDGPGIPEHELTPIREGAATDLDHGSGLGLWLVAWIVRSVGGSIAFDVDGAGSRVTLSFPRAGAASEDGDQAPTPEAGGS